jgi:hypothetical protein
MLEQHEWEQVLPDLIKVVEQMQHHRAAHGVSLAEAKDAVSGAGALKRYFEITGHRETNIQALWHHRLSLFGPPCSVCDKPLRTPRAKMCAECGSTVGPSTSAGGAVT